MIAGVVKAEKEERKKDHDIQKTLLGYDPEKWVKADAEIRAEDLEDEDYQCISLVPPTKGKHRFAHCQVLYEEVHAFLAGRRWAPAQVDSDCGGITWVELFALFDMSGMRSEEGQHIKSPEMMQRAKVRKAKARNAKGKKMGTSDSSAAAMPTLDDELKQFKAVVRHVMRHEAESKAAKLVQTDTRSILRRLWKLGIVGHQPAIMAQCHMQKEESNKIVEAILKQKVANSSKAEKAYAEYRERKNAEPHPTRETILLRIARVAAGAKVRWKRNFAKESRHEEDQKEENARNKDDEVKYESRLLACTRCGEEQETKDKQLKVKEGFRALHCKKCGKQERVLKNHCRCNVVWHQCPIHRTDPPEHQAKKADKKALQNKELRATSKEDKKLKLQSSKRKAPEVHDDNPSVMKLKCRRRASLNWHEHRPKDDLLQRIRLKEERSIKDPRPEDDQVATPGSQGNSESGGDKGHDTKSRHMQQQQQQPQQQRQRASDTSPKLCIGEVKVVPCSEVVSKRQREDNGQQEQPKTKPRKQDHGESLNRSRATRAMHEAVSCQQAKKRRREDAAKVEEDLSAVYDPEPQLPGMQGSTKAILERLSAESRGRPTTAIDICSQKPDTNSRREQLAKQKGKNLLRQETAGRISKGELHAINNILIGKPRD